MVEEASHAAAVETGSVVKFRGLAPGLPMPDRIMTKFTWWHENAVEEVDTSVFVPVAQVTQLNTLVNPDLSDTAASEGVVGFGEFSEWFYNYLVRAVKVTVEFDYWNDAAASDPLYLCPAMSFGISIGLANASPLVPTGYMDRSVTPNFFYKDVGKSTRNTCVIEKYFRAKDIFGPAEAGVAAVENNQVGPFGGSPLWVPSGSSAYFRPSLGFFMRCLACQADSVATDPAPITVSIICRVKLEMYTECFNTTANTSLWVLVPPKDKSGANLSLNSGHTYIGYCRPTPTRSRRRRRRRFGPPRFLQSGR